MNKDDVAGLVELKKLQKDAGIPHLPTQLTYQLRRAVAGYGTLAYQWADKPHRLVYDACREIEAQADTIEALQSRIEALEAALRDVFIHGHSEGWRGNQMRRDVKHEDAEKSWSLYVSNGALEKTIARKALESQP